MGITKDRNYILIDPKSDEGREAFLFLSDLVAAHHEELEDCEIGLAWRLGINPDVDGRLQLGQAKVCSELDRQLHQLDCVVLLNRESWREFDEIRRKALLDHELTHLAQAIDPKTGEQRKDDTGRLLWRTRKHDLEEFGSIAERYGCWKRDLEQFYGAIKAGAQRNLFSEDETSNIADIRDRK